MSAIYFHTQHADDAKLRGSERHWMGSLCSDVMMAAFGDLSYSKDWILPLLPQDCYVRLSKTDQLERSLRLYLRSGDGILTAGDKSIDTFTLSLNTAFAMGGDALRLMARLHGQSEIHCYIEGPNRKWVAEIIAEGRRVGLYREQQGWEEVATILRQRNDAPVVCSFSVCESFPNFEMLSEDHPLKQRADEGRFDEFYDLPKEEAWESCIKGLRSQQHGLEIRPDNWSDFHFDPNVNVFNLRNMIVAKVKEAQTTDGP